MVFDAMVNKELYDGVGVSSSIGLELTSLVVDEAAPLPTIEAEWFSLFKLLTSSVCIALGLTTRVSS